MEKGGRDLGSLLAALAQMGDQLQQLDACLDDGPAHSPPEQRKRLVLQARFSFDRVFCIAKAIRPTRDSTAAATDRVFCIPKAIRSARDSTATASASGDGASSDLGASVGHKHRRSARKGSWLS